jgi:hypothetical protein
LPLPSASAVEVFELRFEKIIYLQQIHTDSSVELKIEWWGMPKPQLVVFDPMGVRGITAKYLICCPLDGLLSYFEDSKVLAIDVAVKGRNIGKAYLNFLVLKGWRG